MARFSSIGLAALLLTSGSEGFAPPSSKVSSSALSAGRTLYDKIWDDHVVTQDDSSALIYIDRHLVHEVSLLFVVRAQQRY